MACITKSSCRIFTLLRYYAVLSGNSLPVYWEKLSFPSPKTKESKTEHD